VGAAFLDTDPAKPGAWTVKDSGRKFFRAMSGEKEGEDERRVASRMVFAIDRPPSP
jgi:hypothetical protein